MAPTGPTQNVMVLLDSPGFMDSRWTEAELAQANNTNLQVLQVIWPDHEQSADAAFSFAHNLAADDFKDLAGAPAMRPHPA